MKQFLETASIVILGQTSIVMVMEMDLIRPSWGLVGFGLIVVTILLLISSRVQRS